MKEEKTFLYLVKLPEVPLKAGLVYEGLKWEPFFFWMH